MHLDDILSHTMVDELTLDAFRSAAEKQGIGYQTLMNQKLKESLPGLDKTLADRVAALEMVVLKTGAGRK